MDDNDLIGINTELPPVAFRWDLLTDHERLAAVESQGVVYRG